MTATWNDLHGLVDQLEAEQTAALDRALADSMAARAERDTALGELARVTAELEACRDGGGEDPPGGIAVPPGATPAEVQRALDQAGPGGIVRLSGAYSWGAPLRPKPGQTIVGPATIDLVNLSALFSLAGQDVRGVTFQALTIKGAKDWAIQTAPGTTVRGCTIMDCGWNAVRGNFRGEPAGVLIEDCEFSGNGWDPDALGHGAGGVKFFETGQRTDTAGAGVTCRRVYSHHNVGQGIWFDHDCAGDLIEDCELAYNTHKGLFYEVSWGPFLAQANRIHHNGQDGVRITNTAMGTVRRNIFGGNGPGTQRIAVAARKVDRVDHGAPFQDVRIMDNALAGDVVKGCDLPGVSCSGNV